MNPIIATKFGFGWKWNVRQDGVPIEDFGRVYYVVDDFGNYVMVNSRRMVHSLQP